MYLYRNLLLPCGWTVKWVETTGSVRAYSTLNHIATNLDSHNSSKLNGQKSRYKVQKWAIFAQKQFSRPFRMGARTFKRNIHNHTHFKSWVRHCRTINGQCKFSLKYSRPPWKMSNRRTTGGPTFPPIRKYLYHSTLGVLSQTNKGLAVSELDSRWIITYES